MQKTTLKGFIQSISPQTNRGTTKANSQIITDPKISTQMIIEQLDYQPRKEAEPQLVLMPSTYRFMINLDKTLQVQADKLYANIRKPDLIFKQQLAEFIASIRIEVQQLFKVMEVIKQEKAEHESMQNQLKSQMQVILQKEMIIRNIEETYMEQMQQMQDKYEVNNQQMLQQIQQLQNDNDQLKAERVNLVDENSKFIRQHDEDQEQINQLRGTLFIEVQNNKKLITQVDILKDIRGGSQNVKNCYKQFDAPMHDNQFYEIISASYRNLIFKALAPVDIFNLIQVSKYTYFIIQNNRQLVSHIVQYQTATLRSQLAMLKIENNYFNEMAHQIPDEVIQIAVAKFLAFKFNAGQYMTEVFNDAFELIEGKLNHKLEPQQQLASYENEDLIGIHDDSAVEPIQQQQPQPQQQPQNGMFSKLKIFGTDKPKHTPSPPKVNKQQQSLSELSIQIQSQLKGMDKLLLDALQVPFLKEQMMRTRREMSELVKTGQAIKFQLFQAGAKCIASASNPYPSVSIQEFMSALQLTFSRLVVNSHYLQLECQQLQHLCIYLANKMVQQQHRMQDIQLQYDDNQEEILSLKNMRTYFQDRIRQFEDRIHRSEEDILNLKKANMESQQSLKGTQIQLKQCEETVAEKDSKINTLVNAIKQIKAEKDGMANKLHNTLVKFQGLKLLIPQLLLE